MKIIASPDAPGAPVRAKRGTEPGRVLVWAHSGFAIGGVREFV
jgi:hypothetical protein